MSASDRSTSTWPLALALACLVAYASLYPFDNWRNQGLPVWAFLSAPLPRYWTWFDVAVNVLGYSLLGFLLALAVMRGTDWGWPVMLASLGAALLSLSMEMLQGFLPSRVPSNLDLALNALGAWLGALAAYLLERLGALQRWGQFRRRWFTGQTREHPRADLVKLWQDTRAEAALNGWTPHISNDTFGQYNIIGR